MLQPLDLNTTLNELKTVAGPEIEGFDYIHPLLGEVFAHQGIDLGGAAFGKAAADIGVGDVAQTATAQQQPAQGPAQGELQPPRQGGDEIDQGEIEPAGPVSGR